MTRKYGWAAWKGQLDKLEELLKEAREAGFDYVEFSLDYPLPYKADLVAEIVKKIKDFGLAVSFHAPWRGLDVATLWPEVRKASIDIIKKSIRMASELGAEYVVYHVTTPEKLFKDTVDEVYEAGKEAVAELTDFAREMSVEAAVENVGNLGTPEFFGILKDETRAKFCFDVAHAVTTFMQRHKLKLNDVDVDEVIELWKNAIGGRTLCAHVHGVEAPRREHRPLGYPLTKRAAAKAYVSLGADYVTYEIYYVRKGEEATPKVVGKEMKDVRSWELVYEKRQALVA
ncbi:sugar phosphate isomerase/epimerase family protein [Ignicoccus hospitalis]|uniref:Xylose isomerase domain protein TIM barrel n=1 Tax=Ignicoccus hospitalis (strain KIN4/I / DSM 18386 / JCM 14125) TaxID=453591 RepID=A8A905_IGNH4|nr:sugar phosphate isomerase/epimerase family protein [Ignicoccus hospitalis]ABU81407.1 Xylose isomerase domain protein TIM barrel [Ignicoccus hospitalis KIN4/I]HIH90286.1 sugar phosphate isomerase/epimerase [Desulfurococcaceae archaeon]